MKKKLHTRSQNKIENLREKVKEMVTIESESIISQARETANQEAKKILIEDEKNLTETKKKIDTKFDEAIEYVVSSVLK
ncbi:MAG: hypothetical protein ACT4N1_01985 [Nitrososphaerota archaeon]